MAHPTKNALGSSTSQSETDILLNHQMNDPTTAMQLMLLCVTLIGTASPYPALQLPVCPTKSSSDTSRAYDSLSGLYVGFWSLCIDP